MVISTFQEECENIYLSLCVLHNKEEADVSVILSVCTHTHTLIKIRGKKLMRQRHVISLKIWCPLVCKVIYHHQTF